MNIRRPLFNQIEEISNQIDGWCPADQLYTLYLLTISTSCLEGDIVEIGSWCGKSSVILGLAAKEINSNLHCIDLFPSKEDWFQNNDGTFSFKVEVNNQEYFGCVSQTVWEEPYTNDIKSMYERHGKGTQEIFSDNINKFELTDVVSHYKGTSSTMIDTINKKIKLAFIDGDHGYEATKEDILNVEKFLVEGGWIIFDDAFTVNKGVDKAIEELIINSGKYELCYQLTRKCFVAKKRSDGLL